MRTLLLLALCGSLLPGQSSTKLNPDCGPVSAQLTAPNQFSNITSGHNVVGCTDWTMTYYVDGFSAVSVLVQAAPDNAGVAGTWASWQSNGGTVTSGSNPSTVTTSSSVNLKGYFPWNRVFLTSATGSGSVNVVLYGCRSPGCSSSSSAATPATPGGATGAIQYKASATTFGGFGNFSGAAVDLGFPTFIGTAVFSGLGTASAREQISCSDCTVTSSIDNTCASGGAGAQAFAINGVWKCFF